MSYLQKVIATKKAYLFYQDSNSSTKQPIWRLMNMHILEEFIHFFPHPDSFKELTEENVYQTDVTLIPELTIKLEDVTIKGGWARETITKILQLSQFGQDSAYPNHRNKVQKIIENRKKEQQNQQLPSEADEQKSKKDQHSLVGAVLHQTNPTEEVVQGKKQIYYKSYVLYFESNEDWLTVLRAIQNGKQWVQYYYKCLYYKIYPDYNIRNWIIDYSNEKDVDKTPFCIDLNQFHESTSEKQLECFKIFTNGFKYIWSVQFTSSKEITLPFYKFEFLSTLFNCSNLTIVSLSKCSLDDDHLQAILPHLSATFSNLRSFNLSYNVLTDVSLDSIIVTIPKMRVLQVLDLSHNLYQGEEVRFRELIQILNLQEILDIDDKFYDGIKLLMSHNQLKDSVITTLEQLVIFAKYHQLFYIDISHNELSCYGLWRLFASLQVNTREVMQNEHFNRIVINLFPLPFNPSLIDSCLEYFFKIYKSKKIYEQEMQREYKNLISRNQQMMGGVTSHLTELGAEEQIFQQNLQTIPSLSMQIIRKRYQPNKPLPNKLQHIKTVRQISGEVLKISQFNLTVEEYKVFCQQIYDLEFEFPLQKLEPLQQVIWDKLNEAFLIRDHYSISILMECSKCIGLEVSLFQDYFSNLTQHLNMIKIRASKPTIFEEIKEEDGENMEQQFEQNDYKNALQRKEKILKQIDQFLNFDCDDEWKVNKTLDYLVKEAVRLDLRGSAVELLFLIKDKRDILVQRFLAGINE